jgi:acyl carrier protein
MVVTIEDIVKLVGLQLGKRGVQPSHRIVEDLGAESGDIINIMATVEERFGVFIDEAEIGRLRTVEELYHAVRQHLA